MVYIYYIISSLYTSAKIVKVFLFRLPISRGCTPRQTVLATPPRLACLLAQVYWLYTRGEFNEAYLLSGFLITEVDKSIHTIEKHSEAEVGHSEQV